MQTPTVNKQTVSSRRADSKAMVFLSGKFLAGQWGIVFNVAKPEKKRTFYLSDSDPALVWALGCFSREAIL